MFYECDDRWDDDDIGSIMCARKRCMASTRASTPTSCWTFSQLNEQSDGLRLASMLQQCYSYWLSCRTLFFPSISNGTICCSYKNRDKTCTANLSVSVWRDSNNNQHTKGTKEFIFFSSVEIKDKSENRCLVDQFTVRQWKRFWFPFPFVASNALDFDKDQRRKW